MMEIQFIGSFSTSREENITIPSLKVPHTKIRNLLIYGNCRQESEGEYDLTYWGTVINLTEIGRSLGMENAAPLRLLDLFLAHPLETILSLIDGNVTGILTSSSSTVIFRDKNGGGIPVYYSPDYFSTHVDGLRATLMADLQPDLHAISFFLTHGYIPSPHTGFQGISKIPAGHYLVHKNGEMSLSNAFPFSDFTTNYQYLKISENEAIEQYIELHRNAIRKRISHDSTVGILLSGGYDSGGNLARLRDVYSGTVKSFSIGFKGNPWSELPHARQFAKLFDTDHYEYEMDGKEIEYLPEIINGFSDPFQENGLMVNICAMKLLVSQHPVSTTICGEGNDQLFGIHSRELAIHYVAGKTGLNIAQKGLEAVIKNRPFLPENLFYRIQFNNDRILHILRSDRFGFRPVEQRLLFKESLDPIPDAAMYNNKFPYKTFDDLYLGKTYFLDIQQITNEIIVYKAANTSRLFGNTLGFPLLDMEIYRFITSLPISYRIHGSLSEIIKGKGISKYLFKASLKGKLPEKIVGRKKQGGFAPLMIFFMDENRRERIFQYILSSDLTRQLFNPEELKHFLNKFSIEIHRKDKWFWYDQSQCFRLFSLLVLSIWWDQFINNKVFLKLSDYIGVEVK